MWFSKVPGYIFHKQKTPYLTEAKDLTLAQSQYELTAYGVFVGTIYGIVGLAALLSIFEGNNLIHYVWLFASISVIYCIFNVTRKYELFSSYIISMAPSVIVGFCFYEALSKNSSLLSLTIFVCLFLLSLKYGWRISRIVSWQRYTGEFENYNIKKEKA
jgi:hypothetical protein